MADVDGQVKTVSQKAEHIKATIYQAIHKEYSDFFPSKSQNDLLKLVKPLLKDVQRIEERFENEVQPKIHAATTQHKDLLVAHKNTKEIVNLLEKLCTCHRELSACKSTPLNQYVKSAKHLEVVKKELDELLSKSCDVKIFKVVRNEYAEQQTRVMCHLYDAWSSLFEWSTSTSASWDSMEGHLKTSLKIDLSGTDVHTDCNTVEIIQAMDSMHILQRHMKSFGNELYTYLIKPLLKFQNLVPMTQSKPENKIHTLKIGKKSGNQKIARSHVLLYKKIMEVLQFLTSSLFAEFYKDAGTPVDINPMSIIGGFIWKELSETLINDHLAAAVPSTNSQMEKYESTIKETIQFELDLVKLGFIMAGTNNLSKYVKDVNVHFANKVCQDILSEARDLMFCNVHNLIEVDCKVDRAAIPLPAESEIPVMSKKIKNMLTGVEAIDDDFLNVDMFGFPHCQISESVQRLVDFIYQTMVKATESPYPMACQIFYSCRDTFELFVNVVPTYHKENLKLPQMAAVHYNNCMYLAHHCITLGHQFRSSLPGQLNSSITTFVDYVTVLRKCGTDCFLEQLRCQQKELLAMLDACNNFTECTSDESVDIIKRSLNQIIHHLTRVAKQWNLVLPVNIFKKSVAVLFNTVLENIISSVFKMEDISVDEAGQLHAFMNILIDRGPEIIQTCSSDVIETGIIEHVRSWTKFEMLATLLEASLQEIVDMWHAGEGELEKCMTEGEVRTLIRALFQNTERRSQALARIKHKTERS